MSNVRREEDYEVFISYSHRDNVARPRAGAGAQGWVTHFDQLLEYFLREWYDEPRIWRDDVMRGGDIIDETILTPLPRASILITVVSPNYIRSQWCARERTEFCRAATESRRGLHVLNKSRIFTVAKTPLLTNQQLPDELSKVNDFKFFDDKEKDKRPKFFGPHDSNTDEERRLFDDTVGDVAWEVRRVLDILTELAGQEPAAEPAPTEQPARDVSVYLAAATPDLENERNKVRRELIDRGYNVVELSADVTDDGEDVVKDAVREELSRCGFSIHLIGDKFGDCPNGGSTSFVELQDSLAAERAAQSRDFQRMIWLPDYVRPEHLSQRRFVNALLESNFLPNTELLRRSLEDFKTFVNNRIRPPRAEAAERPPAPSRGTRTVGVVCESLDTGRVARLEDCLYEQGYDVNVVVADGPASAFTEEHADRLSACDGVVVYMDNAPLFWVQSRLQDVAEIEGRRSEEFSAVAVYVSGRTTEEKNRYRTKKAVVIKNLEDMPDELLEPIPPHLLRPFLDKLDEEERGQVS